MSIPLFDAHCDTIFECARQGKHLRKNDLHVDLERGQIYEPYAQIFAIWTRPEVDGKMPTVYDEDFPAEVIEADAAKLLDKLLEEFEMNKDILTHCRSAADAKKAAEEGKIAAFIAIEGAELIGCDIARLHEVYDKGVRFMNLCWNYDNALCGAANGKEKYGLTEKGREFVKEMQKIGMAVDLSHASDKTFWDVMEITTRPVMVGHSNSRNCCENPRNITDEMFNAVTAVRGVVGLNFCKDFLNSRAKKVDAYDIVRHGERFKFKFGGINTICMGGDLDGIDSLPEHIEGIQDYDRVYNLMCARNWDESRVKEVFYGNLMRFTEEAL